MWGLVLVLVLRIWEVGVGGKEWGVGGCNVRVRGMFDLGVYGSFLRFLPGIRFFFFVLFVDMLVTMI